MKAFLNRSPKFWVLADQAMVSGSSFVTNLLVAHALGLSDYGKFSIIILVQLFLLSIQQAISTGIFQVVAARYAGEERRQYVKGVFYGQCLFYLFLATIGALIFLFAPALIAPFHTIFIPGVIGCIFFLAQDLLRKILLTLGSGFRAFVIDAITNTIQLALLIFLMKAGSLTLPAACWTIGLTFIPSIALGIGWVRPGRFGARTIRATITEHKGQGSWMLMSALLQWFAGNFFVVAAGWWLGLAALGALRLAQYIFGLLNVVLQAIENYTLPRASLLQAQAREFNDYLQNVLKKSVFLIVPVLILVALSGSSLLSFSGGREYAQYGYVMYGLAAVYSLIVLGIPVRIALRVKMLNQAYFLGYVLATAFSMLNARWMIRAWGLGGVLSGLFLTQLIVLVYWFIILKKKNIIKWKSSISS